MNKKKLITGDRGHEFIQREGRRGCACPPLGRTDGRTDGATTPRPTDPPLLTKTLIILGGGGSGAATSRLPRAEPVTRGEGI